MKAEAILNHKKKFNQGSIYLKLYILMRISFNIEEIVNDVKLGYILVQSVDIREI